MTTAVKNNIGLKDLYHPSLCIVKVTAIILFLFVIFGETRACLRNLVKTTLALKGLSKSKIFGLCYKIQFCKNRLRVSKQPSPTACSLTVHYVEVVCDNSRVGMATIELWVLHEKVNQAMQPPAVTPTNVNLQ